MTKKNLFFKNVPAINETEKILLSKYLKERTVVKNSIIYVSEYSDMILQEEFCMN